MPACKDPHCSWFAADSQPLELTDRRSSRSWPAWRSSARSWRRGATQCASGPAVVQGVHEVIRPISEAFCPMTTPHKTRRKHPSPYGGAKEATAHALLSNKERAAVHVLLGRQEDPT
jgi:hypothetical protein